MPFEFEETKIPDVKVIKPQVFGDERGFFMETYVREDFEEAGIEGEFIQDNHSRSEYGVLRGLHFQKGKYSQAKIVQAVKGVVYDVAVDLREESSTFGEYVGIILSEYNKKQLYVPRGFAHGFCVLSDSADIVYKVDNDYAPDQEAGVMWNDPTIGVDWPIEDPKLSEKDTDWPTLDELKEMEDTF